MDPATGYCIVNGVAKAISERFIFKPNQVVAYEVIRVIAGKPLFFLEHFQRLVSSSHLARIAFPWDKWEIKYALLQNISLNKVTHINIKIEVFRFNSLPIFQLYPIPSIYPTSEDYSTGVKLGLLAAERSNPNAKTLNRKVRAKADEKIAAEKFYEVLLLNSKGEVTEGSRSNFFLVGHNSIITPQAKSVLPGITRQKIIQLALGMGIEVVESAIQARTLGNFPAAFLSGTSPGILPICSIENTNFKPNNAIITDLANAYNNIVYNDLSRFSYGANE